MSANLAAAGYSVAGYDVHRPALDRLTAAGGLACDRIAEAVADADVVITMLPDSPQVEEVVLGEDGVLDNARGTLLIDMSTIRPETSRRVRRARLRPLPPGARRPGQRWPAGRARRRSVHYGRWRGKDFQAATGIFEVLGKTVVHVGPHGAGQTVKAANQLVVGGTYALVAEAILLLEASGVDAGAGLEVLAGGLAGSRILELKRKSMVAREFQPGFRIDLHHKDMGIVLDAAREAEVALPSAR